MFHYRLLRSIVNRRVLWPGLLAALAVLAAVVVPSARPAPADANQQPAQDEFLFLPQVLDQTEAEPPIGEATVLVIDEDAIDNGIRFYEDPVLGVQNIFPETQRTFSETEVNDDLAEEGQRAILRYFAANVGRTISVLSGQTGDEGWFGLNCIPQRWAAGSSDDCATDPDVIQQGIANYVAGDVPQEYLDEIPAVRPLRALGLVEMQGQDVCAVVYDSDVSINYTSQDTEGNLQGANLGLVALRILDVVKLEEFSSSSLPEVQITILDAEAVCAGMLNLFDAPIPPSSSEPEDTDPDNPPPPGSYLNR